MSGAVDPQGDRPTDAARGPGPRRWFITGAGSGFGRRVVRTVLRRGEAVVATDVSIRGLAEALTEGLPEAAAARLQLLPLELRDPGTIRHAAATAVQGGPVDVLVNNAGYAVFGTQAEADLDAVGALFEANVIGTSRLTQALLPALRARRGTVVQVSSVAGRVVFPESGFYAATKHALEALSEALYLENAPLGLSVVVVEPGNFATGFQRRAARVSAPRDPSSPHAGHHGVWDARRMAVLAEPPQDAQQVADAIWAAVSDPRPFLRVAVGADARAALAARRALGPQGWVDAMATRHGAPRTAGDPLGSPAEVLAAETVDPTGVLATADAAGLLDHWLDEPGGAEALERLRSEGPVAASGSGTEGPGVQGPEVP